MELRKIPDVSAYLPRIDGKDADADFRNDVPKNSDDIYAVCDGDQVVGLACIRAEGFLYVYIFAEHRHKGYGSFAAQAAEQQACAGPVTSLSTAYDSRNEIAAGFAQKRGFIKKFSTSVMVYPGEKFDIPALPVRKHQDADFPEAYTLSSEAFHRMRLETGLFPDSVPYPADEEARRYCAETADERYVYMLDQEIIGCAHLDGAEIDNVAIKIPHQGKGHGKAFVKFLVNEILDQKIGTPFLYCLVANRKARHVYDSLGFVETACNVYAVKNLP